MQRSGDQSDPRATAGYIKSGFVTEITDDLIDTIVRGFEPHPGRSGSLHFQHSGGIIGRVATDATAFAHRYAKHDCFATVSWPTGEPGDEHVHYVKDYFSTIEPFTHGFYVNDIYDETQPTLSKNYQGNFERLVRVKNKYDPTNLFRLNANVVPTV